MAINNQNNQQPNNNFAIQYIKSVEQAMMKLKAHLPSLLSSSVSLAADIGDVRGDFVAPKLPSTFDRLYCSDDERGSDSDWSSSTVSNT